MRKSYKQCKNRDDEDELFESHSDLRASDRIVTQDTCHFCTKHIVAIVIALILLASLAILSIVVIVYLPDFLKKSQQGNEDDGIDRLNPVVQTNCGAFVGKEEGGAYAFKGIPYAQPPVGRLRWKRPLPMWSNTTWCRSKNHFKATTFGSPCFQLNPFQKQFEGKEDCLYLNVWTPTLDPEAGLEVMVWVHGGFLQFGSGHQIGTSPSGRLSKLMNVVFVSFNYRLHVLGYLALDALYSNFLEDSRGNYGTWDQLVVMQWVRDHILYFGGDAKKVTLFGADGGAASILAMLSSPHFRDTFRSAWLLGPAVLFNRSFSEASLHTRGHWLERTGCGPEAACLRDLRPKEATAAYLQNDDPSFRIRDQNDLPIQGILPEQMILLDGDILPLSPVEAALRRTIKDVPLLIGTSAQAVDFWPGPEDIRSWRWSQYRKYVTTSLDSFDPRISQLSLQLYNNTSESDDSLTPELLYTTMVTDIRQTCPINDFTEMLATVTSSPVYRYIVTSRPSNSIRLYNYPGIFSTHLWDAVAFFDQMHRYLDTPSPDDLQFRDTVQRIVLDFVKSSPTRLKPEGWLKYPNNIALLGPNITLVDSYHKTKCKFWAAHGLTDYAWVS